MGISRKRGDPFAVLSKKIKRQVNLQCFSRRILDQKWLYELEGCEKKKKTEYRHRSWPLAVGPRVVFKCSFWAQVSGGEATDGFGCH